MRAHLRFFKHVPATIIITPPPFDHSKLVTMDGEWCLIGSSNWDARSFRLNFEFDLECCDQQLTGKLDEIIDAKIARGPRTDGGRTACPSGVDATARCRGTPDDAVSLGSIWRCGGGQCRRMRRRRVACRFVGRQHDPHKIGQAAGLHLAHDARTVNFHRAR